MAKLFLSTQGHRSHQCPHTFRDNTPCSPTIYAIDYVFARVGRALLQMFQDPTSQPLPATVHELTLRRADIQLTLIRDSGPKFDMVANQPFQ